MILEKKRKMNKQELIKRINKLPCFEGPIVCTVTVNKNWILSSIEQLDEPQKVTVPQFVADWIEKCKSEKRRLHTALNYTPFGVNGWVSNPDNQETFARAWLDGYEVEKEKRYYVRFKGMESGDFNYLNFIKFQHAWVLSSIKLDKKFRTEHTKKELEEAGFGWVFDCEGIELEEVE